MTVCSSLRSPQQHGVFGGGEKKVNLFGLNTHKEKHKWKMIDLMIGRVRYNQAAFNSVIKHRGYFDVWTLELHS